MTNFFIAAPLVVVGLILLWNYLRKRRKLAGK